MKEDLTDSGFEGRMQSGSNQKAVNMETKGEPSERPHGATSEGKTLAPDPQPGVSDPTAACQEPQRLVLGTRGDTAVRMRDLLVTGTQQSYARPVLQQLQRSAAVSGVTPQVPAVNVASDVRDNVASDVRDNVASDVRDNVASDVRDNVASDVRDNVASDVRDNVASDVRDNVASDVRDNVASDVQDNPAVTGRVVASGQQEEICAGGGSSGNVWSHGSPFSSDTGYTIQALKRRNVVRFRHRGAREELPSRSFVIRELLCNQMGFRPTNILALISLPNRQGYDVSFKVRSRLRHFWANFFKFRDVGRLEQVQIYPHF